MNCRTFTLPCHQRRWITPDSSGATPRWRNSWGCPTPCLRLKAGPVSGAAKLLPGMNAAGAGIQRPSVWRLGRPAGRRTRILLGEQQLADGRRYDWHLKGAGLTPYSRMGDGRAVLRSTLRESLASEAMHALGIPTTRALAMVTSDTPVYRERVEPGAMLMRVAESHVRFRPFRTFFTIAVSRRRSRNWPTMLFATTGRSCGMRRISTRYGSVTIVMRTAQTIASWQTVGFAHGVMNTDNMSILGLTIDYGPYGFLDDFQPDFICNHSDYQGRYSFENQPAVGLWNLQRLAHSLSPLYQR